MKTILWWIALAAIWFLPLGFLHATEEVPRPVDCYLTLADANSERPDSETTIAMILIDHSLEFASRPTATEPGVQVSFEVVDALARAYQEDIPTDINVRTFVHDFVAGVREKARAAGFDLRPTDLLHLQKEDGSVKIRVIQQK